MSLEKSRNDNSNETATSFFGADDEAYSYFDSCCTCLKSLRASVDASMTAQDVVFIEELIAKIKTQLETHLVVILKMK